MILGIRTDAPEATIVLCDQSAEIRRVSWQAHRQLAETLHQKIDALLEQANMSYADITAVMVYEGPGSFTGLRIGLSVANAAAYALHVPMVGTTGDNWVADGIEQVRRGATTKLVLPEYGAPVHLTTPRK